MASDISLHHLCNSDLVVQTETGKEGANKYEKTKQKNSSLKQFFYLLKRGSRTGVFLLQEFYESFKSTYFAKHL